MAHLVGINKGPVMDWTNDSGLDVCYRKWRKQLEVLFKGPLSELTDAVKCNYVIYWSSDNGMDLVDKWTTEKSINDGNKNNLDILGQIWGVHTPQNQQADCSSGTQVTIPRYFKLRGLSHKGFKTSHSSWLCWWCQRQSSKGYYH